MATYIMLGNFTEQGIRNAKDAPERAKAFKASAEKLGIAVRGSYAVQGQYDVVQIVEAPDELAVTALVLSISGYGHLRWQSLRAFTAAEWATILQKVPANIPS